MARLGEYNGRGETAGRGRSAAQHKGSERMPGLRDVLARLLAIPGVRAAVLVGREGLPIEIAGRGDQHFLESLGAHGASALGTTEALGQDRKSVV